MGQKRIAIIGSGVSGLSALWSLRNTDHEIHILEKANRLGGHTNTVTWTHNGHQTPVDTGFIVLNTATYPNFIEWLRALRIKTLPSKMTFGVSRDNGDFEWSGTSLSALFAQPGNVLRPTFWRMLFDIVRFNQFALDLLDLVPGSSAATDAAKMSIGEYLQREGYSTAFRDDYLIPMTACVWSTGPNKCTLEFPALTLVRFMWNHHLLTTVSTRPPWLTIENGAKTYIDAVMNECSRAITHLSTSVTGCQRKTDGKVELYVLQENQTRVEVFDEVILACHGNQARRILGDTATLEERAILEAFETTPNTAYLHRDLALMPKRRTAWSAWNYLTTTSSSTRGTNSSSSPQTVSLTYDMNTLQNIPPETFSHVLVTLNPEKPPSPSLTQGKYEYEHPLYNARVIAAQDELKSIQGKNGIWYAGAWTGYGFHEDGCRSGIEAGRELGGEVPWEMMDAKFIRGLKPVRTWKDYLLRTVVQVVQAWICFLHLLLPTHDQEPTSSAGTSNNHVKLD